MSLEVDGLVWTTTFLSEEVIDLQGDPMRIKTSIDLHKVTNLMDELHRITGRRVVLMPEASDIGDVNPYLSIG